MVGRLLRLTGTVLVIAVAFVTPVLVTSAPATAAGAPGSWQTEQTYASTSGTLSAISCTTAADCIAGGSAIVATTDGGASWTSETPPSVVTGDGLHSISCPSITVCFGSAGAEDITSSDGGVTWNLTAGQFFGPLLGISCPSTTVCIGVDGVGRAATTTDGGTTWTPNLTKAGFGPAGFIGISCPSTAFCAAAGEAGSPVQPVIATSTDEGASWSVQILNAGTEGGFFNSVSCPSTSECTAVGTANTGASGAGIAYTDLISGTCTMGPGCNQLISFGSGISTLSDVSCASPTVCTAVGQATSTGPGVVVSSGAGTSTWATESTPTGISNLLGISCPAVGACTAVGQNTSGGAVIIGQAPTTFVGIPSNGATITGTTWLDAGASSPVGIASVSYELSGGSLSSPEAISGSTPTLYGYIGAWNSTSVPNGTYTLQSVATDTVGQSTTSAPITVTVNNPPPSTSVVSPLDGATLSGTTAVLDAGASADVTSVSYELSGGTLSDQVIATATPTIFGWLAVWNTTSVPNGTYTLQSVGTYSGGAVTSAPITITVTN